MTIISACIVLITSDQYSIVFITFLLLAYYHLTFTNCSFFYKLNNPTETMDMKEAWDFKSPACQRGDN